MNKSLFLAATLVAAAAISGCDRRAAAPPPAADTAAIADAIKAGEAQWVRDYHARDAAKALAHYSANASLMPSNMAPMRGSNDIGAGLKGLVSDPAFGLQFSADKVRVAASGDLAFTRGTYTLHVTDPTSHKPIVEKGTYITVYEKQADGSWKAVDDMTAAGPKAG